MIFNRDKKNNTNNNTDSLEDSAIDRWKSLNKDQDTVKSKESEDASREGFFKRNSYLNSLMKDQPTNSPQSTVEEPRNSDLRNPKMLETIALTNEVNHFQSQTDVETEDLDCEFEGELEDEPELDSFHIQSFEEKKDSLRPIQEFIPHVTNQHTISKQNISQTTIEKAVIEKTIPKTPPADFSLNFDDDLKARFGTNLRSALGEGTMIDGTFSFETPVKVDGCLTGEIRSPSALIVGKNAIVNARIKVGSLIVIGSVEGEIEAQDLVEIRASGSLSGDVITKRIALEEGGLFNGSCTILD